MLTQLLITILVLGAILGGWLGLQEWIRRTSADVGSDCDVLEGRWGCHGCTVADRCDFRTEERQPQTP